MASKREESGSVRQLRREIRREIEDELETMERRLGKRLDASFIATEERIRTAMPSLLRGEIATEARKRVKMFRAFLAGFLILGALGLWKPEMVGSLFHDKFLKPPSAIFPSIRPDIATLSFEDVRRLREAMPDFIWSTLETGDKERYARLMGAHFYDALEGRVLNSLIRKFGTADRRPQVKAADVAEVGQISVPAVLTMIGTSVGDITSCGRSVEQDKFQAIVVLPRSSQPADYGWFGCTSSYPNVTELLITVPGRRLDGVTLIGVERTGTHEEVEVRLTKATALALELAGAESFASHATGNIAVSRAED